MTRATDPMYREENRGYDTLCHVWAGVGDGTGGE